MKKSVNGNATRDKRAFAAAISFLQLQPAGKGLKTALNLVPKP